MAAGWMVLCLLALAVGFSQGENTTEGEDLIQNSVQAVASLCQGHMTVGCLQLELLSQLERLTATPDLQILPGVFLSRNVSSTVPTAAPIPTPLPRDLGAATRTICRLLVDRSLHQMKTWTLSMTVFGNDTLQQFRNVMESYLSDQDTATGRKAKYWKWVGTALLTVAFSILSALVSKALTLSVVALAMNLMRTAGGFGFGAAPAAAPAVAFRAPPPALRTHVAHSAELQYLDDQDDGQPYVYVNKRNWKMARSDQDYDTYYNKHYYA